MKITVCIGSSCHLKGSYRIVQMFQEAIEKNGLEDKVSLAGTFCLGKCSEGVSIKIEDQIITGVSPDNFIDIFNRHVLGAL